MKKFLMPGLFLMIALLLLPSAMNAGQLSFRLYGGGNYLAGGDLNLGLQGWEDFYTALRTYIGYPDKTGSAKPVHLGFNLGGDVLFHLTPNWAVGIGTEILSAKKTSNISFGSPADTWDWEFYGKPSAIPIKLSAFYFSPLSDKWAIQFHAGLGYYFAKTMLNSRTVGSESDVYIIDSKAEGFGFHGGVGLEMKLSSNLSLLVEAAGRYASISGFTGSVTYREQFGWDGTLRYWEAKTSYSDWYGYIDLTGAAPTGENVRTSRDAKIDFSGFSLRIGVILGI